MNFPSKILAKAVEEISGLPSIGKKSALEVGFTSFKTAKIQGLALSKAIEKLAQIFNIVKNATIFQILKPEICANEKPKTAENFAS